MKKYFLFLIVLYSLSANSQSIIGAWERLHESQDGDKLRSVVIFAEGYQVISVFTS